MKFSIQTEQFKKGLDTVNHAVSSISTTPILENILLKVENNTIILTGNNLEMAIEHTINDGIEIEQEGALCIPSKLVTNYVNLIEDDSIQIEGISGNSIQILTGSSQIKVKGIEAEEFPLIPNIEEETKVSISGKLLQSSIDKTIFSSAEGNIRPTLAGIFVKITSNELVFASTDSFRLSEYKKSTAMGTDKSIAQIIPSKTCNQIKGIVANSDMIDIILGENQIAFLTDNAKIYSRLLNGKFPDYGNFFPSSYSTKVEISRVDLISALRKINLLSKENNFSIKMSISNTRGVELETTETQIGEGNITLIGAMEGDDNIIGVNSTFLLEVLGVIKSSHVSIRFENPLSPILITPTDEPENEEQSESFKHIIMPLKI